MKMSKSRFIDLYPVILLDMGNTFMFDCDRFGPGIDYHSTYIDLGGARLNSDLISILTNRLFHHMLAIGENPDHYDDFGTVASYLKEMPESRHLPPAELDSLEAVFAQHEVGKIPNTHASVIWELSRAHTLGVVSNIWSHRDVFEKELGRVGVLDLFDVIIWSSDYGCIKPSVRLFQKALAHLGEKPERAVFVGDNLIRDVGGAKAAGMATVWVNKTGKQLSAKDPKPDLIISDLTELLRAEAVGLGD